MQWGNVHCKELSHHSALKPNNQLMAEKNPLTITASILKRSRHKSCSSEKLLCNSRLHGTQRTGAAVAGGVVATSCQRIFSKIKKSCMTGVMMAVELSDVRLARGCRAAVAFAVLHEHACYSLGYRLFVFWIGDAMIAL
jgi:hypothetical protein